MKLNRTIAIIVCSILTLIYFIIVFTKPLNFWPNIASFFK